MTKLHLGCGQTYFDGYVNIDFPQTEHTVQSNVVADKYEDIIELEYPENSVEEIRLHHVFEHFPRPTALALLCRWRNFLKPGSLLRIETPDVIASFKIMTSNLYSFEKKQQVMRHLFGSHEAKWAFHVDGWYKEKFEYILNKLGFRELHFKTNEYRLLKNIEVFAYKSNKIFNYSDYYEAVQDILLMNTIKVDPAKLRPEGSELDLLHIWENEWGKIYTFSK